MTDVTSNPTPAAFEKLGYVDRPFVAPAAGGTSYWVRLVGNAAANRLLAGIKRAQAASRPAVVHTSPEIPDYYYRVALNDMLARTASEPELGIMALNIPLEMMRLGRIRGTLAELAELTVAVDMPLTMATWFRSVLDEPDGSLAEAALITVEDVTETRALFESDPRSAVERFFGFDAPELSPNDMDAVIHEAYLRQLAQPVEVEKTEEASEETSETLIAADVEQTTPVEDAIEAGRASDADVREYLLALARTRLSPVLSRAMLAYARYGESMSAQEMKITRAPRKTLAALLKFMSARWGTIAVIYDTFDAWPMLDQKARLDVIAAFTELRYIIAEAGVMVLSLNAGTAPEMEEQFAAGEQIDWLVPEIAPLSRGEEGFDAAIVQSWLDGASLSGRSPVSASGPELAPLVAACEDNLLRFAEMAEIAFRDAAARGLDALDDEAVTAGLAR